MALVLCTFPQPPSQKQSALFIVTRYSPTQYKYPQDSRYFSSQHGGNAREEQLHLPLTANALQPKSVWGMNCCSLERWELMHFKQGMLVSYDLNQEEKQDINILINQLIKRLFTALHAERMQEVSSELDPFPWVTSVGVPKAAFLYACKWSLWHQLGSWLASWKIFKSMCVPCCFEGPSAAIQHIQALHRTEASVWVFYSSCFRFWRYTWGLKTLSSFSRTTLCSSSYAPKKRCRLLLYVCTPRLEKGYQKLQSWTCLSLHAAVSRGESTDI